MATIVTLAVELVISWNKIKGANSLDSAAQIIPPVITGAFLVHGLCVWAAGPDSDSEASSCYYYPRATIHDSPSVRTSGRRRRPSYHRRRLRRSSRRSSDFLNAYPDMFDLPPELSLQTPPASLGGHTDRYASGYYDIASDYYGMQSGDYIDHEARRF